MAEYIKKNSIPIIIEIVFTISCFLLPKQYFIYSNFIFYTALFVWFVVTKEVDFGGWKTALQSGKRFWIQTVLTGVAFLAAFVLTSVLEGIFPQFRLAYPILKQRIYMYP